MIVMILHDEVHDDNYHEDDDDHHHDRDVNNDDHDEDHGRNDRIFIMNYNDNGDDDNHNHDDRYHDQNDDVHDRDDHHYYHNHQFKKWMHLLRSLKPEWLSANRFPGQNNANHLERFDNSQTLKGPSIVVSWHLAYIWHVSVYTSACISTLHNIFAFIAVIYDRFSYVVASWSVLIFYACDVHLPSLLHVILAWLPTRDELLWGFPICFRQRISAHRPFMNSNDVNIYVYVPYLGTMNRRFPTNWCIEILDSPS